MTRLHLIRAFCDWLISLSEHERQEYEAQPGFQTFHDLTDGEVFAAVIEMRRRVRRLSAEMRP